MHIPDGYLSPTTCVAGYLAALPVWYIALKRTRHILHTRVVPLIAVFAAFSFVVMMFDLPVPGGTTAHAVGVGIAAIVLGPWASMLAITTALFIQAIFFGDGGITSFGFNSINMAVIGAWVAYASYHVLSIGADRAALRRVIAAGIAGYLAINASALAASIEFGLQPLLFHTADGTPLYAPYPLHISIPAMMIAHLSVAGLAEAICCAGIFAWLQHSHPELLNQHGNQVYLSNTQTSRFGWSRTKSLWAALGVLMIVTPLGLLATAEAWGEWGVEDFASDHATMSSQSLGFATPAEAPSGLQKLADIWTAPIPDYAPTFMHSDIFGYLLSAFVGVGLIIVLLVLLALMLNRFPRQLKGSDNPI